MRRTAAALGAVLLAAAVTLPSVAALRPFERSRAWTVTSVTDGDTLWVARGDRSLNVRLVGINAPESGECLSGQATRTLRNLVQDGPVRLVRDVSDVDQYGRALRYVRLADGRDAGAILVRRGLALARRDEPDTSRAERYERIQARAEAAGRGLWAPDACGPVTTDADISVTLHVDAHGDDNVNLNDEWVQFTNVAGRSVDMTGWQVADESASHRYTFGSLVLRSGRSVTLFSGCGVDSGSARHWCNTYSAVWNNDGDTVFLRDRTGNLVLAEHY